MTAIVRDFTTQRTAEAELRRSRARILEAADAERRRLERDLHDGAQQRLVSLSLALRLLRSRLSAEVGAEPGGRGGGRRPRHRSRSRSGSCASSPAASTRRSSPRRGWGPRSRRSRSARRSQPRSGLGSPIASRRRGNRLLRGIEALANVAKYAAATSAKSPLALRLGHAACRGRRRRHRRRGPEPGDGHPGPGGSGRGAGRALTVHSPPGQGTRITPGTMMTLTAPGTGVAPSEGRPCPGSRVHPDGLLRGKSRIGVQRPNGRPPSIGGT